MSLAEQAQQAEVFRCTQSCVGSASKFREAEVTLPALPTIHCGGLVTEQSRTKR